MQFGNSSADGAQQPHAPDGERGRPCGGDAEPTAHVDAHLAEARHARCRALDRRTHRAGALVDQLLLLCQSLGGVGSAFGLIGELLRGLRRILAQRVRGLRDLARERDELRAQLSRARLVSKETRW
ncbi:MAG: hypothetical protein R3A48_28465 [Polyangiales bacterium]